jgi:hypothetical protein
MQTIDGIDYAEHGDVVEMEVHRGGGYVRDSSIHEGGRWTRKLGVVTLRQAGYNPGGENRNADGTPRICWVVFFDGDMQATNTAKAKRGFPDGLMTYVRPATPEELEIAEAPFGFRGRPYPLGPIPGTAEAKPRQPTDRTGRH